MSKKYRKRSKKTYTQPAKLKMGEYYEEKPFKIHAKEKRDKYDGISNVIKNNNENVKRKKLTKAQTMTVKSSKTKTTIIHPKQRKELREQKMAENSSKLLLSRKFDFNPEEILDKSLLFELEKKTSADKIFDSILEKIPDKNDIYYIEHREGTNSFRL